MLRNAILLGAITLVGCSGDGASESGPSPGAAAAVWLQDVAVEVGVDFLHDVGPVRHWMPEVGAGGVALFDMDADGDLDLYLLQGTDLAPEDGTPSSALPTNRMYRNRGDGTFDDVTESAGVGDGGFGYGCAVGDYDGDGKVDLYVVNVGPNVLYRNVGDGRFEDVTEAANAAGDAWGTCAAFLDLDVDGDQDLFVSNYIHWSPGAERLCRTTRGEPTYCSPNSYEDPARDSFLRNRGDGTFEDASVEIGLDKSYGNGFGIAWGRIDDRPGLDVYVANDGMANQLWSTAPDGTLVDRGPELGCALSGTGIPEAGMGISMADVDHDGRWDLMLTHLEGETNTLYRGGRRGFRDASGQSGTTSASLARTGFGIGLVDFDHDGQLDLYTANGGVKYPGDPPDPTNRLAEPDQVFRGGAKGRFEVLPAEAIVQAEPFTTGRGAAFGDIDEDGDVDVVLNDMRGRLRILRNVAEKQGGAVTLSVLDRDGLPAVGAEVRYRLGDVAVLRQVQRTYSYCASNDPRVHVGLGAQPRLESVDVTWLDGTTQSFGPFEAGTRPVLRRE